MRFSVLQALSREAPKLACYVDMSGREPLDLAPTEHDDLCVDHSLSCKPVHIALLEAEKVARQIEPVDLTPPVTQDLAAPDSAAHNLVNVLRLFTLAINLLIARVSEGGANEFRASREQVGCRKPFALGDGDVERAYGTGCGSELHVSCLA